jgi:hypothetical protein
MIASVGIHKKSFAARWLEDNNMTFHSSTLCFTYYTTSNLVLYSILLTWCMLSAKNPIFVVVFFDYCTVDCVISRLRRKVNRFDLREDNSFLSIQPTVMHLEMKVFLLLHDGFYFTFTYESFHSLLFLQDVFS